MATNHCPACGKPLAVADLNITEGVGLCRSCGKLSRLAEIADHPDVDPGLLAAPPAGCSCDDSYAGDLVLRASLRSIPGAVGTLAICLFWNGIVSVFLLIAVGGLYAHLVGPLPAWFPAPSKSDKGGGSPTSLGEAIFLCIFMIPFVTVGVGMICAFLTCLMGRVEVRISGTIGKVRTGIGPFNWTRRFDPTQVKRVTDGLSTVETNGKRQELIVIECADRGVKFGSSLPDYRRQWLKGALHLLLVAPGKDARRRLGLAAMARG